MDTGHKYLYPLSPPPLPLKHENNAPVLDLSPYPRQRILPPAKTSALLFLWGGWGIYVHGQSHVNGCNNARLISLSSWAFPGLSEYSSSFFITVPTVP